MPSTEIGIVLFTCDLRVHDNAALAAAAARCERIVPLFVFDEDLLKSNCASANRLAFLRDCLEDLHDSLRARGAGLLVRHGEVAEQALRVAKQYGASSIDMSEDCTPYARDRSERLHRACEQARVELHEHPGPSVVAPGELTPGDGGHYRVFTPYWRVWSTRELPAAAPTPCKLTGPPELPTELRLPKVKARGDGPSPELSKGGESRGRERLTRWLSADLSVYGEIHDDLTADRTSRLSAFLHFGCVSPRTVLERAREHPGAEDFARQLCWRDFHRQVLADRPDLPSTDYRPRGDRWRRSLEDLDAWREGRTGYPIVDAGMRQLASEGYMHNRARLIVSSFLSKTLYVDWRRGAEHFASLLIDADVANNVGNWQWMAGTGNDTRPNRVLNPLRQAERFDPDGAYVRRWVPELSGVSGRAVQEPWRLPVRERELLDYPDRIVDHEHAARELRARRER